MITYLLLLPSMLLAAVSALAADSPPLRVARKAGVVEIDNGLIKARFTPGKDGVKQEYLAARGGEWVLLAEDFRPVRGSNAPVVESFADFEGTTYGNWQVVGDAFGAGPSPGATAPEQRLQGFLGQRLANSYAKSDQPVGKLISPEFTIRQPFISFLIGGGNHPGGTCINLVVDGKTVATQTGENSDTMRQAEWRVAELVGKKAHIEIVDNVSDGWGHIEIDQIEFADQARGSASLYDTAIDPAHRFLVTENLQSIGRVEKKAELVQVVLQGRSGETRIEQTVEVRPGQRLVHIEVKAVLAGNPPKLDYLLVPLVVAIDGKPDVTHAPTFKPTADSVIGDRVFFAPVVCVQQGGLFAGLVPDLDIINRHVVRARGTRQHPDSNSFPVAIDPETTSMPTALDLELQAGTNSRPVLAYGMIDYIVHQHVWFQHASAPGAMVRALSTNEVRIGMDLLLSADAPKYRGYQIAARHLWQRYGGEYFRRPKPQAMPNAEYAKICYPANLNYQGYDVTGEHLTHRKLPNRPDLLAWQQWEVAGQPVGGLRLYAPQWYNFIANLGWWNNVCDATGLYYWGKQLDDKDWLEKARRMVSLTLSAPQNQGLFPGIYDLAGKRWLRSLWGPPMQGYNPGASAAYWDWNTGGAYQTAAASVTAGYLLQYRRTCEDDARILPYVRRYGDFLLGNLPANGCVPGWFSADLKPLPSLKWNADGGAHVWVLSELYLATKEPKYLAAAKQAAKFLLDEVLPQQRWADFETFYSCAIKPETYFDTRTGQWPLNTMSTSWALHGFLALHEATQERQYLEAAEAAADFASLFQAAWAPHYVVTAYPFGGLSSQLGDAEWLDQRAHRFADPFVRIGLLTGRQDLIERGIAAARSALTLANHPRHQANGVYTHTDFPVGLGPENIDHEGFPQRPLSSGPSWNSVGGLAGVAHVMDRLGGAYINFEKNLAVGVDGLKIGSFQRHGHTIRLKLDNQLAALPAPYEGPYAVELRIVGLPAGEYTLQINDRPPQQVDMAALSHFSFLETPKHSPRIKADPRFNSLRNRRIGNDSEKKRGRR